MKNNRAYIILKPDAVYQNLEIPILDFFEAHGIKPIQIFYQKISKKKRTLLYKDFYVSSRTNWDMGTPLYELGTACHIILEGGFPNQYMNLSQYISKKLKGYFVPQFSEKQTVRSKYNALNPVFNLIHSSDSSDESKEESEIFLKDAIPNDFVDINNMKNKCFNLSFIASYKKILQAVDRSNILECSNDLSENMDRNDILKHIISMNKVVKSKEENIELNTYNLLNILTSINQNAKVYLECLDRLGYNFENYLVITTLYYFDFK